MTFSPRPLSLLVCVVALGCARGPQSAPDVPVAIVTVAPPPPSRPRAPPRAEEHALDVDFEHKIRLIGYRVSTAEVAPNDEVVLTLSWTRDAAIEPDWLFFVHVKNGVQTIFGDPNRVAVASCALNVTCAYEVRFRAPDQFSRLDILAGIWRGADRMSIARGAADEDQRAIVGSLSRSSK